MNDQQIRQIMEAVASGAISVSEGIKSLGEFPQESVGNFAVIDHQREIRTGFPEVIFGPGKTEEQIVKIFERLHDKNPNVLASRISPEVYEHIRERCHMPPMIPLLEFYIRRRSKNWKDHGSYRRHR